MSSYNVKIQFDYLENWLNCEIMYLRKNSLERLSL
jgi:hypothetical protein